MTFETEEVRDLFHRLPAQKQFEWTELEGYLAKQKKTIHVTGVTLSDEESEVFIRIYEKL